MFLVCWFIVRSGLLGKTYLPDSINDSCWISELSTIDMDELIEYREEEEFPTFLEYSGNLDMHGYYWLGKEKGIRRLLWWVLFIGCIIVSVIMFAAAVKDYQENAVYHDVKNFKLDEHDIIFPTITICNKIPLTKKSYERVRAIVNITQREYEEFYYR